MHLASSYYTIYNSSSSSSSSQSNQSSQSTITSTTKSSTAKNNNDDNQTSSSTLFWQEFELTNQEKLNLNKILQQNQTKCDILQNAITKQRGQYIIDKYDKEAISHWDNFYSSHETNFFKDRHYLYKAFPNEFGVVYGSHNNVNNGDEDGEDAAKGNGDGDHAALNTSGGKDVIESDELFTITEIGCGVGNTVLPLLELDPYIYQHYDEEQPCDSNDGNHNNNNDSSTHTHKHTLYKKKKMFIWGLDFSSVAIDLLRKDKRYINATTNNNDRTRAQQWDITSTQPNQINTDIIHYNNKQDEHSQLSSSCLSLDSSSNISLLLFVLSAISPDKMQQAAHNVASTLKPGGTLVFRDYGRYDEAQIKLGTSRNKRLSDNFYVKHDGTRCYYFTIEDVERLFGPCSGRNGDGETEGGIARADWVGAGLEVLELKYVQRVYKNRSDDSTRKRIWVQARFRKPIM